MRSPYRRPISVHFLFNVQFFSSSANIQQWASVSPFTAGVSWLSRPDQLTRLQTTSTWDELQQTECSNREVYVERTNICSPCRDGDETCVISASCLSDCLVGWDRWLREMAEWPPAALEKSDRRASLRLSDSRGQASSPSNLKSRYRTYRTLKPGYGTVLLFTCR